MCTKQMRFLDVVALHACFWGRGGWGVGRWVGGSRVGGWVGHTGRVSAGGPRAAAVMGAALGDGVRCVAWSRDGRFMADCGHLLSKWDGSAVRIRDTLSGQVLVLKGHLDCANSVAVSSDSRLVVSGADDGTVMTWDRATGRLVRVYRGHAAGVTDVAISWRGNRLASCSRDGSVIVWDGTPEETCNHLRLLGHTGGATSVAICDSRVASGGSDRCVRIWDTHTGRAVLPPLRGHSGAVMCVALNRARVVSGSDDKTVRVWDACTGELLHLLTGHTGTITSVAMGGMYLASGGGAADRSVRVWDALTGRQVQVHEGAPEGDHVLSLAVTTSPFARVLSASCDGSLKSWELQDSEDEEEDAEDEDEDLEVRYFDCLEVERRKLAAACVVDLTGEEEDGSGSDAGASAELRVGPASPFPPAAAAGAAAAAAVAALPVLDW